LQPGDFDAYHFAGMDEDGSNFDAQYRKYNPTQGRWLSPDPYDGSYDFSNPQSLNRYNYVLNNPLSYRDPLGLMEVLDCNADNTVCVDGGGDCWWCWDWGFGGGGNSGSDGGAGKQAPNKAPNNGKAVTQQCLSQYNNSTAGKVVQFFSLYNLATNFEHAWAEWTVLPAFKFLSLKGLDMASQAVGNTHFLSVTGGASTNILSPTAGLIQGGEKLAGAVAGPGIAAATGLDVIANAGCGTIGRQAAGQMTPLPPGVQVSF